MDIAQDPVYAEMSGNSLITPLLVSGKWTSSSVCLFTTTIFSSRVSEGKYGCLTERNVGPASRWLPLLSTET